MLYVLVVCINMVLIGCRAQGQIKEANVRPFEAASRFGYMDVVVANIGNISAEFSVQVCDSLLNLFKITLVTNKKGRRRKIIIRSCLHS